jgi:hypothetical protein
VRFAILGFDQWHGSLGRLLEEEERALAEGYNGLRITGKASFLTPGDWPTFMEYEQALSARFHGRRIVTICSYARARCNDQQTSEVMHPHHCAFERPDTDWQVIAASEFSSRAG